MWPSKVDIIRIPTEALNVGNCKISLYALSLSCTERECVKEIFKPFIMLLPENATASISFHQEEKYVNCEAVAGYEERLAISRKTGVSIEATAKSVFEDIFEKLNLKDEPFSKVKRLDQKIV